MRRKILLGLTITGVVALIVAIVVGYRYYDSSAHYVSTDNALIKGDVVQVAPMNGGRVDSLTVDVGDSVKQGQTVATIDVAVNSSLGLSAAAIGPAQGTLVTTELVSPVNGVVVARRSAPGDAVTAQQPLLSVVDLGKLWVTANVDEAQIARVRIGQAVDVHVDTLDRTFKGRVSAIAPASAAVLSSTAPNNTTAEYTRVGQLVPVNIAVDYAGATLMPGTSAEVDIRVS
jgi:multidrug resistance efflux pump